MGRNKALTSSSAGYLDTPFAWSGFCSDHMALPARWLATSRCCWPLHRALAMLALCCILQLHVPWTAHGQGLNAVEEPVALSTGRSTSFRQVYRNSTAWRNSMKTRRSTACTKTSGSLCGSSSSDELAALQLATAPHVYDARSKFSGNVVGPVKDQGECGMW
jgi:hypothetical protein